MLWLLAYVSLFQWTRSEDVTNVLEQTENSSVLRSVENTWILAGWCLVSRNWKRQTCPCSFCSKMHLCRRTTKIPEFCRWTFGKASYFICCIKWFPDNYVSENKWLLQSSFTQTVGEGQKPSCHWWGEPFFLYKNPLCLWSFSLILNGDLPNAFWRG